MKYSAVSPPFSSTAGEVSLELRLAVLGTKAVITTSGIKICPSPHPKPFRASGKILLLLSSRRTQNEEISSYLGRGVCVYMHMCVKGCLLYASIVVHVEKTMWNGGQVLN